MRGRCIVASYIYRWRGRARKGWEDGGGGVQRGSGSESGGWGRGGPWSSMTLAHGQMAVQEKTGVEAVGRQGHRCLFRR